MRQLGYWPPLPWEAQRNERSEQDGHAQKRCPPGYGPSERSRASASGVRRHLALPDVENRMSTVQQRKYGPRDPAWLSKVRPHILVPAIETSQI